jgi:hypothetical protein
VAELVKRLRTLSNESAYQRFMGHKGVFSQSEMQRLVDSDYTANMGVVVSDPRGGRVGRDGALVTRGG